MCVWCVFGAFCPTFRFELFFKNLFKSIHIVEVLKDADGKLKLSPEYLKVSLCRRFPAVSAWACALHGSQ